MNSSHLSEDTGSSDEATAAVMMRKLTELIPIDADEGIPSAARFEQCVDVLREHGDFAGSEARYDWVKVMKDIEDREIGPVRGWLSKLLGKKAEHPVLERSIQWIEDRIEAGTEEISVALHMLLSNLYHAIGNQEKALETYTVAMKEARRTGAMVMQ